VVSQRLLPRADGRGRVVAAEIMVNTPTIRELILDGGNLAEIHDYIAEGREQYGMQTFDQHLADLVRAGEVTYEVAHAAASKPSDFALNVQMLGGGVPSRPTGSQPAVPAPTPARATTGTQAAVAEPSGEGGGSAFNTGGPFDFLNGNG
jgi:hypothetical protein